MLDPIHPRDVPQACAVKHPNIPPRKAWTSLIVPLEPGQSLTFYPVTDKDVKLIRASTRYQLVAYGRRYRTRTQPKRIIIERVS